MLTPAINFTDPGNTTSTALAAGSALRLAVRQPSHHGMAVELQVDDPKGGEHIPPGTSGDHTTIPPALRDTDSEHEYQNVLDDPTSLEGTPSKKTGTNTEGSASPTQKQ